MGYDRRLTCCVCDVKSNTKSSQKVIKKTWRPSTSCEIYFESCFGPEAKGRTDPVTPHHASCNGVDQPLERSQPLEHSFVKPCSVPAANSPSTPDGNQRSDHSTPSQKSQSQYPVTPLHSTCNSVNQPLERSQPLEHSFVKPCSVPAANSPSTPDGNQRSDQSTTTQKSQSQYLVTPHHASIEQPLQGSQPMDQSFIKPCSVPAFSSPSASSRQHPQLPPTPDGNQRPDQSTPSQKSQPPQCVDTPCRLQPVDKRPQPRKLLSQLESTPDTQVTDADSTCEIYTACCLTVGGDWEGLAKFIGLSGPNGKFFCNHCLVSLDDVNKGTPHAEHILPKYQEYGQECIYPLRTFQQCNQMNAQYRDAGEKAKSLSFQSCENPPLLDDGVIIDVVSTTPLHISLGLGLQVLNVIEDEAIKLDREIKTKGGHFDAFTNIYEHQKEILASCRAVKEEIDGVDDKIAQVTERRKEVIDGRGSFFNKAHRSYKTDLAEGVRNKYNKLGQEKAGLIKEKEKLEKSLKTKENKLDKVLKELESVKGPFKCRLDNVLNKMKLKRAAYHSGALIGPDVKKLVTKENITELGKVFCPMELKVQSNINGVTFEVLNVFGTEELRVKVLALLTKLRLCYELYTANRTLCRHEVEILSLRCSSYGNWFPINFPHVNLKRKFHLLTCDVPKQARRLKTTGMITEQTIESIHPYINELDRRFAKVSNKTQKGLIICKQQNMYSQPCWNSVKKRGANS